MDLRTIFLVGSLWTDVSQTQEFEVSSINRAKIPPKNITLLINGILALFMEETSNSCDHK